MDPMVTFFFGLLVGAICVEIGVRAASCFSKRKTMLAYKRGWDDAMSVYQKDPPKGG